jgi:hypothetical protein
LLSDLAELIAEDRRGRLVGNPGEGRMRVDVSGDEAFPWFASASFRPRRKSWSMQQPTDQ